MISLQAPINFIGAVPGIYQTQPYGVPNAFLPGIHEGVDFGCPMGSPVLASADCRVEFREQRDLKTGELTGYGKHARLFIPIPNSDYADEAEVVAAHLSEFYGGNRYARRGDCIGYSGTSGSSSGPHVHWGLRFRKNSLVVNYDKLNGWVNPLDYMEKADTVYQIYQNGREFGVLWSAATPEGLAKLLEQIGRQDLTVAGQPVFSKIKPDIKIKKI